MHYTAPLFVFVALCSLCLAERANHVLFDALTEEINDPNATPSDFATILLQYPEYISQYNPEGCNPTCYIRNAYGIASATWCAPSCGENVDFGPDNQELFDAVFVNDVDRIKAALRDNPKSVNQYDHRGCTPLCDAVVWNRIEALRALLESDIVNVNAYCSPNCIDGY